MILRVKKRSKNCLGGIVLFLVYLERVHGHYNVIGASQPVTAAPGDDVILPCRVSPEWHAMRQTVEWSRLDPLQNSSSEYVLVYRSREVDTSLMMKPYIGRASLFPDVLGSGNVSLKLTDVTVSDSAQYKCFLPSLKTFAVIQLVVSDSSKDGNHPKPEGSTHFDSQDKRDWQNVVWAPLLFLIIVILLFTKKCFRRLKSDSLNVSEP